MRCAAEFTVSNNCSASDAVSLPLGTEGESTLPALAFIRYLAEAVTVGRARGWLPKGTEPLATIKTASGKKNNSSARNFDARKY